LAILEVTMRKLSLLLFGAVLISGSVGAAELAGVTMADKATIGETELALNGLGLREATMLKVDVYVGGLYLEKPSTDAAAILESRQIKRIHMHFVYKKVDAKKIVKGWNEGIEANVDSGLELYATQMEQLNGWMETMVKGDSMIFTAIPGKGLVVEVKGMEKGLIEDEDFARDFWRIWLGPEPPNAGLKEGMLGGS
jgi:hypothetical protein